MLIKSKYKIARRLGSFVFEKTQSRKFAVRNEKMPGQKGKKKFRPMSDYGKALIEKQKARFSYLLGERCFANYVKKAISSTNQKPENVLYEELETRLDSVAFRLGFGRTRSASKQIVSHGHLSVNGKRVTVPSFQVSIGDKIAPMARSRNKKIMVDTLEYAKEHNVPDWLSFDGVKLEGEVKSLPKLAVNEMPFDLGVILDFYKR